MRYALQLAEDCRILSATYEQYAAAGSVTVEQLPEGDLADYRYVGGEYVYDPLPKPSDEVTELEQLRADVDYIAMETGVEL